MTTFPAVLRNKVLTFKLSLITLRYNLLSFSYQSVDLNVIILWQTLHSIEQVFFPGSQPFVTRRQARLVFDIVLVKLGKIALNNLQNTVKYETLFF